MTGIEHRTVCSGVNFRSIRDSRFKTVRMSIHFMLPLEKQTVSTNAILPFLLTRASRKYPDFTRLNEHLEDLYGAELDADVQKLGDVQILSVSASGIADRYALKGEKISAELSHLLCSIVFDPPLQDGLFPADGFEQEKRQLMETIDSEYNDKRLYALRRCEEIMCTGEPYGIGRYGTKEEICSLKIADLTPAWQNLLHNARIEILVLGDCDPNPVFNDFAAAFQGLGRTSSAACPTVSVKTVNEEKDLTEKMDVAQSKLVMGFRTGCADPDGGVPADKLMSALYGGTPNSKLFLNVREKLSLCYYCSSMYNPMKGILLVQSGVEKENIERAKNEIIAQLEGIRSGDFSDSDLDAAKLSLCNSYRTLSDSLDGLEGWYLSKTFSNPICRPEDEAAQIASATREDVMKAAGKTVLDTVFRLTGNEVQA